MSAFNGTIPMDRDTLRARIRQDVATSIGDLAAKYAEHSEDAEGEVMRAFKVRTVATKRTDEVWSPQPSAFDFDTDPEPPDWIIFRTVERGTVVMLSGDTGSAKSIVTNAMLPAALNG